MKDQRALAYVNLFAVLGAIPKLCELDVEAKKLIEGANISIGFAVKDGPKGTLTFKDGVAKMEEGLNKPIIKIPFNTSEKFNGMIDGTVLPIPCKGFLHIGFLLKKFTALTDILTKYLRADKEALKDEEFFNKSTELMLNVIANAVAQLANNDKVSMSSASYIVDGKIALNIGGGQIYFIDNGNHLKVSVNGKIGISQGLCLNALRGVNYKKRTLASVKRS